MFELLLQVGGLPCGERLAEAQVQGRAHLWRLTGLPDECLGRSQHLTPIVLQLMDIFVGGTALDGC
ncbi:hypothetical protein D3C84_1260970 [compost metagenome]